MSGFFNTLKQLTSQGIEGYFATKYADYAKRSEDMQKGYSRLVEHVTGIFSKGKLLEIGPGPAFLSIEIAKQLPDIEITGLEISESMIEIANRNTLEQGLSNRILFKKADASKMPFSDSEFDLVVTSGSLHHWKRPMEVINEIYRVLKPGCKCIISDLVKDAPADKIKELASKMDSKIMRWGFMHSFKEAYTVDAINALIKDTRFESAEIEVEDISMRVLLKKE